MNKQDKDESKKDADGKSDAEQKSEDVRKKWSEIRNVMGVEAGGNPQENLERLGRLVSGKIQFGDKAGDDELDIEFKDDSVMDYRELLKKLCRERERMHEDVDSFDTMLYNYGLEMYGDVPLIEPLETKEEPHFNTIVLAIDTSGSCDGEIAKKFVSETGRIFSEVARMAEIEHLYLIQCDTEIESEIRFDGADEAAEFCERGNVKLRGFGGTDFCPVFERTEELIKEGETVDALIYLTDGCASYTLKKPECPVYFVMSKEDFEESKYYYNMPEWIEVVTI
jgi:predicted metal-dependent peptidase